MITKRQIKKRIKDRIQELNKLNLAYTDWRIGDEEYNQRSISLRAKIEELEELCRINKK